jgi:hypothetical protein
MLKLKNNLKWAKLFTMMWFKIFIRYFTLWGFILFGLYYTGILKQYQESILYTLILISICGLIIVYVNPKKLVIPYINITLKGKVLQVFDILGHHTPLILFLITYNKKIKPDNLLFFFTIFTVYLFLINPFNTYNFNCIKFKKI